MEKEKEKKGWGGARANSGRRPTGRTHQLQVRLSDEAYEVAQRVKNKTEWLNRLIIEDGGRE